MPKVKSKAKDSFVWQHFGGEGDEQAKCNLCRKVLSTSGGSTSGLVRHLKAIHNICAEASKSTKPASSSSSLSSSLALLPPLDAPKKQSIQNTLSSFIQKESTQEKIARLVAEDGMSIAMIQRSQTLRSALSSQGHQLPKSRGAIMEMVHKQFDQVKEENKTRLAKMKSRGERFSVTLDEFTSKGNRRYMNVNVHQAGGNFLNLGMIRMAGRFPADKCLDLLSTRLGEYGLSITDDIVCITTDGAPVMVKMGSNAAAEHQQCYSHAIHLAVCDAIYKKLQDSLENVFLEQETEDDYDDKFIDYEENDDGSIVPVIDDTLSPPELVPSLHEVLKKTRKLVRFFRMSPSRNDVLQSHIESEFGKKVSLQLDVKTRWNSMLAMIQCLLRVHKAVVKALVDLESENLGLSEVELRQLKELEAALEPAKVAVDALNRRETSLLTADSILLFVITELENQNSNIARIIREAITKRSEERRHNTLVSLLKYLDDPNSFRDTNKIFKMASKTSMLQLAKSLLSRLFAAADTEENADDNNAVDAGEENSQDLDTQSLTLAEKLDRTLRKPVSTISAKIHSVLAKEIAVFEATGQRTPNLENLFKALLSAQATSVESERAFSAAGLFVTKLRCRLSDRSINAMSVLRSYYASCK